jgi:uncharacterized protein DUF4149
MFALRYVGVVAVALWVGGLLVVGTIGAPAIFDVLAARQIADGRVLAGAIVGETLRRFHLLAYGCGSVLFVTLLARGILGPRPPRFAVRLGLAGLMLAATAYSGVVVSGQIARTQAAIGGAPSSLADTDPRRVTFGRLHALSTGLQLVPIFGGLLLLFRELED